MNILNDSSQEWEYIEIQVTDPSTVIRQYREEGWELVNAVPVPVTSAARSRSFPVPKACLPFAVAVGIIMLFVLFLTFLGGRSRAQDIPVSQLVRDIRSGSVTLIVRSEDSNRLVIYYGDPTNRDTPVVTSVKEPESGLLEYLATAGVPPETLTNLNIEVQPSSSLGNYLGIMGYCIPLILFIAVVAWIGFSFVSRMQKWSTLIILRRRPGMRAVTESQSEPI